MSIYPKTVQRMKLIVQRVTLTVQKAKFPLLLNEHFYTLVHITSECAERWGIAEYQNIKYKYHKNDI